jgi:hypothetical protein
MNFSLSALLFLDKLPEQARKKSQIILPFLRYSTREHRICGAAELLDDSKN